MWAALYQISGLKHHNNENKSTSSIYFQTFPIKPFPLSKIKYPPPTSSLSIHCLCVYFLFFRVERAKYTFHIRLKKFRARLSKNICEVKNHLFRSEIQFSFKDPLSTQQNLPIESWARQRRSKKDKKDKNERRN